MKKLQISKTSWHYQIATQILSYDSNPPNLCSYFWTVFFGSLIVLALSTICLIIAGIILSGIYYVGAYITGIINRAPYGWEGAGMIVTGLAIGFGIIMFTIHQVKISINKSINKKAKIKAAFLPIRIKTVKPKQPNIILEGFRSWKKKTCFLIEFKEEKDLKDNSWFFEEE